MTKTAFVILGAIVALAAHSAPALAQDHPVRAVSYADLDLSSVAGRMRLDQRLETASRRVCGSAWLLDLRAVEEVRRCRVDTFARAAADRRTGEVYVAEAVLR